MNAATIAIIATSCRIVDFAATAVVVIDATAFVEIVAFEMLVAFDTVAVPSATAVVVVYSCEFVADAVIDATVVIASFTFAVIDAAVLLLSLLLVLNLLLLMLLFCCC